MNLFKSMARPAPLQLIAIVPAAASAGVSSALRRSGDRTADLVIGASTAAVVSQEARRVWKTRKRVGVALVTFQQRLERIHAAAATLPAAPGATFANQSEVERFLATNEAIFVKALDQYGEAEQHQIVVEVPGDALLARIADHPGLARARALMAKGERMAAGQAIQAVAEGERAQLRAAWTARLAELSTDFATLPQPSEDAVVNGVALTARGGCGPIEHVLEEIDAQWGGRTRIRLIGPSAASSFASVLVERPDIDVIRAAETRLGVAGATRATDVKTAYRKTMKRLHPDIAGPDAADDAREAAIAHTLMMRVAAGREALQAAGFDADVAPMLATLRREGDAREEDLRDAA